MLGKESAIDGAVADESGGRIVLVESEGSNIVDMVSSFDFWWFAARFVRYSEFVVVLLYGLGVADACYRC
jgi:hypothetical protein